MSHRIEPLGRHPEWISTLASWQFDYWGRLTGFEARDAYVAALERWSAGNEIPTVTPRLRRDGVGAALVTAAIAHARRCGFGAVYLYTSATLPQYCARLGWTEVERLGDRRLAAREDARAAAGVEGDHVVAVGLLTGRLHAR